MSYSFYYTNVYAINDVYCTSQQMLQGTSGYIL